MFCRPVRSKPIASVAEFSFTDRFKDLQNTLLDYPIPILQGYRAVLTFRSVLEFQLFLLLLVYTIGVSFSQLQQTSFCNFFNILNRQPVCSACIASRVAFYISISKANVFLALNEWHEIIENLPTPAICVQCVKRILQVIILQMAYF